jgi:hypothetical protein
MWYGESVEDNAADGVLKPRDRLTRRVLEIFYLYFAYRRINSPASEFGIQEDL